MGKIISVVAAAFCNNNHVFPLEHEEGEGGGLTHTHSLIQPPPPPPPTVAKLPPPPLFLPQAATAPEVGIGMREEEEEEWRYDGWRVGEEEGNSQYSRTRIKGPNS